MKGKIQVWLGAKGWLADWTEAEEAQAMREEYGTTLLLVHTPRASASLVLKELRTLNPDHVVELIA